MFEISPRLATLSRRAEERAKQAFEKIDATAFCNQKKVMEAFRRFRVSTECFNPTTGYGYDDLGRDRLDSIFADVFEAEAAFVRHQIISGTHALTVALFGLLRPGDVMLAVTGRPYDTLEGVIGLSGEAGCGSLRDFGVRYDEIPLLPDSTVDLGELEKKLSENVKIVYMQKSPGYSTRRPLGNREVKRVSDFLKAKKHPAFLVVDNCYCEFCEEHEPPYYGADLCIGSLIKNPGGGMAETGAYLAGTKRAVELAAQRLTVPGIGLEAGASLGHTKSMYKGLFYAPHTVAQALKSAVFAAALMEEMGYGVIPGVEDDRFDIVQQVELRSPEAVEAFCRGIQSASPVDSFVSPIPWEMPGYQDPVIMAAGAFTQGSSIELSADAPMRAPYTVYLQGGLTFESAKLGILAAAEEISSTASKQKNEGE